MLCRVITLKYDERLGGFPEEPLRAAQACGDLLEVREHFFERGGVPHLALTLLLDGNGKAAERPVRPAGEADPGKSRNGSCRTARGPWTGRGGSSVSARRSAKSRTICCTLSTNTNRCCRRPRRCRR